MARAPINSDDAPGHTNVVPATPAAGQSRPGRIYNIFIRPTSTGDTVAITVFEPSVIEGGKHYPLVLHSHGYQGSRYRSLPIAGTGLLYIDASNPTSADFTDIRPFVENGYGVVSIDQRAHGDSNGDNRVMDPDFEGKNLIAILDWIELHLDWLAYGPSVDGLDPHNLMVGAVGSSYGNLYQLLLNNIDPGRRLDALVPEIGPYDIPYSLSPNDVLKTAWLVELFALGQVTGLPTGSGQDPFVTREFVAGLVRNRFSPELLDYARYHSNRYFCEGVPVASNGELNGQVLQPERPPVPGPAVHAWFWQGFRDTLFNFNEAYANYQCLKARGGDVRLSSYQRGHNSFQTVPDPGGLLFQPLGNFFGIDCGGTDVEAATLAFFDRYLKGVPDALEHLNEGVCLSLSTGDSVVVDRVTAGRSGVERAVPATVVTAGIPNIPVVADLGIAAGPGGDVLGGIPRLEISLADSPGSTGGEPILMAGLGIIHAALPTTQILPELIDNQLTPLRGVGRHDVDMVGVAERLAPGDRVVLLLYGGHDQYLLTGSLNLNIPTAVIRPVTVSGRVWVPMLGPAPQ